MRKRPGQQRSQQMVDILLEASGRVIACQGLANLTTNRVAAEADVSIGSLYQYFANKQELLEALLERMALDMTRLIDARMTQLLAADVRTAVKMLLGEMLAFIRGGDGRYLELVRHWQQLQTLRVVDRLEQHLSEVCRRYLRRHVREFPIENPIPVLFVIINGTLMTLVRYLALENPPLSEEELIDSLTEMLAAYLACAAQHRASPPLAMAPV
jgi:AcrR family transcriptional regulator